MRIVLSTYRRSWSCLIEKNYFWQSLNSHALENTKNFDTEDQSTKELRQLYMILYDNDVLRVSESSIRKSYPYMYE